MSVVAIAPYEFTPRDVRENVPARCSTSAGKTT